MFDTEKITRKPGQPWGIDDLVRHFEIESITYLPETHLDRKVAEKRVAELAPEITEVDADGHPTRQINYDVSAQMKEDGSFVYGISATTRTRVQGK